MTPPLAREKSSRGAEFRGAERGAGSRAEPAELRRTATVARHHDMPLVAAALDAAAERIEGLEDKEATVARIVRRVLACYKLSEGACVEGNPYCDCRVGRMCERLPDDDGEALNPSTQKQPC